jgi:hypothetical protein
MTLLDNKRRRESGSFCRAANPAETPGRDLRVE